MLHHGRGTDELDLLPLADALDPARRLHVVTPRGPLQIAGSPGYHWYTVPRVGHPDPQTFAAAFRALAAFHDELWERTGIAPERTILGGFSMGAVMSYALALARERPCGRGDTRLLGLRSRGQRLGAELRGPHAHARLHRPWHPGSGDRGELRAQRARPARRGRA